PHHYYSEWFVCRQFSSLLMTGEKERELSVAGEALTTGTAAAAREASTNASNSRRVFVWSVSKSISISRSESCSFSRRTTISMTL
ncbi:hypothetical protein PFISCL1PPCAC_370, partial [Pristionchus fissidentatus]